MRSVTILFALLAACAADNVDPSTAADPELDLRQSPPGCVPEPWPAPPVFEDDRWIYSAGTYIFPPQECVLFRKDKMTRQDPQVLLLASCDSWSISMKLLDDGWIYYSTAGGFGSDDHHRVRTDGSGAMNVGETYRGSSLFIVGDDGRVYAVQGQELDSAPRRSVTSFHVVDGLLNDANRILEVEGDVLAVAVYQGVAYFVTYGNGPGRVIRAPFDAGGVASVQMSTAVPEPRRFAVHGGELLVTGKVDEMDSMPARSLLFRGAADDLSTLAPVAQFERAEITAVHADDLGVLVVTRRDWSWGHDLYRIWRVLDDGRVELIANFLSAGSDGTNRLLLDGEWVLVAGMRVRRDCPAIPTADPAR